MIFGARSLAPATPRQGTEKFDLSNLSLEWAHFGEIILVSRRILCASSQRRFFLGSEKVRRKKGREGGRRRGGGQEGAGRTSDKIGVQFSVAEKLPDRIVYKVPLREKVLSDRIGCRIPLRKKARRKQKIFNNRKFQKRNF